MFWGQNKLKIRHLALVVAFASGATAAAADILVVRSAGPSARSFPPGKSIPETSRITLKANDMLVVLDGRGTRTLRGPGTFTPGGPAQASSRTTAIGALTSSTPQRRARIGAVRSVGTGVARSPTIWHVDVTKSATVCLADPTNVMLWRADASKPATMTITRVRDGAKRDIKWQTGTSTMVWPADLTISGDSEYRLSWAGAPAPTNLRFRTLSTKPAGLEDMASSLIQNGCNTQLDLLIETVKLPDDATPPAG